MKTVIKLEGKELFVFNNSREFNLGEEVKCYGEPHIVVSVTKKRTHFKEEVETIVTLMKKEMYNGIKVSAEDFDKYGLRKSNTNPFKQITIGVKNAPMRAVFDRNPFNELRGY